MLETYFVKPQTAGRIRACWIGAEIERYAGWLAEQGYSTRTVQRHVQALVSFGEFARRRGASALADLPAHVDDFVAMRVAAYRRGRNAATEVRSPVEQMLTVVMPGFERTGRPHRELPFGRAVPGFFEYLADERGLRPDSIAGYRHHLACFEAYLGRIGAAGVAGLSPAILSAFVAERSGAGLARTTVRSGCGVLRVFLRYAHRQGLLATDLSKAVEWPTAYRLADIPRSISREEVALVLAAVDRSTPCGKRDYAILLLLVTYGLRAREVAALTLDDIDWRRDRLAIPGRKAGHSTAFPLSAVVGEALVDYLRHGRPPGTGRHVFFRALAPAGPASRVAVSACARHYLLKAGIQVPRPGSHTLRHTCVQRLVDAGFGFKAIGDFIGHRSPASTAIYAKVAIEPLRQVALGDGEQVLA
ncbi:MAG TPA: site-specific integrase [Streptosporangiaceae bacterium]|jgi:site-specific recombinase XerD|nr:site-specific integrase [Streptosporangiaceae bacterium]